MRLHRPARTATILACLALLISVAGCSTDDRPTPKAAASERFCADYDAVPALSDFAPSEFAQWQVAWKELAASEGLDGVPAKVRDGVALQADLVATSLSASGAKAMEQDLLPRETDSLEALEEFAQTTCGS